MQVVARGAERGHMSVGAVVSSGLLGSRSNFYKVKGGGIAPPLPPVARRLFAPPARRAQGTSSGGFHPRADGGGEYHVTVCFSIKNDATHFNVIKS